MDSGRAVVNTLRRFQGQRAGCSEHVKKVPGAKGGLF